MQINGSFICRLAALIVFILGLFGVSLFGSPVLLGLALWLLSTFL